jgi:membrane protein CcdC involved in cytochrome C biogenesis
MTTSQYFLNLALLAWIISSNLGTRTLTRRRVTLPLFVVAGAGWFYLKDLPTVGNDGQLELVGLVVGVVLGVLAALTVRVHRDGELVLATAGAAFVAIWVAVIGGRVLFAYGAEHWFSRDIGEFSRSHLITGADAWTAAFVIMALAMVVSRLAVTGVRAARLSNQKVLTEGPVALYR